MYTGQNEIQTSFSYSELSEGGASQMETSDRNLGECTCAVHISLSTKSFLQILVLKAVRRMWKVA
jgi:hypothetical protein